MKNTLSPLLQRFWRTARPWLVSLGLVLILRYTGVLGAISNVTGTLLLKTGLMDASVEAPPVMHEFSYDFSLVDMNGNHLDGHQLRGRTLFINLWATWCGPCRVEMPSIEALYRQTDTSRVAFLMISVDEHAHRDNVRKFALDKGFTFPVYMPAEALPDLLQVPSIPTTLIIAPDGKVVVRESGLANYNTPKFQQFLESL
ncbi:TlpA disulfide reductase family protein [Chryseolinea sp. T2]|uniref:TlpA family protein disulfide reductase n=1 Tax=Chryseolinea sp. T2 TaxID=3129255 RepID=UPI003077303C